MAVISKTQDLSAAKPCLALRFTSMVSIFGVLVFQFLSFSSSIASTSNSLLVTPAQQHSGKLRQFEKKNFSFTLKNQISDPIHIISVEHSCGCTEAKVNQDSLAPSQETQIIGSLDSGNRLGEFGSQIGVTFKQGRNETVLSTLFKVGAKAVTVINVPSHLDLDSALLGQWGLAQTFAITRGEADLKWDSIKVNSTKTKTELKQISDTKWNLTVNSPASEEIGTYREDINLALLSQATVVETITLPVEEKCWIQIIK